MAEPDQTVSNHIEALVAEEHALLNRGGTESGLDRTGHERLAAVRIELDRSWDLMRQRRARREAGLDPGGASERPAETVENYEG